MSLKNNLIKKFRNFYHKLKYDDTKKQDKIILSYLKNKQKILDIACADGYLIELYIKENPKGEAIGIDNNHFSINECKKKGLNVKFVDLSKLKLPFQNEEFDAIIFSNIIEHLYPKEVVSMFDEMSRILKKGGILVIRAPLLYHEFYTDISHIRPYHPKAILEYLCNWEDVGHRTFQTDKTQYSLKFLKYRHNPIIYIDLFDSKVLYFLYPIVNMLKHIGIKGRKNGYLIILERIK
ncbi:MAG: class I SAM-dependent methyltransferase [Candidatus Pacearchaeota archaeon]|jgi:ubiquinone/menaquinone biosynthesis C-methylase UbiE